MSTPIESSERPLTAEQLVAAFILDAPIAVKHLYGIYGSRTTFHAWRKIGLSVKAITGMGPTVVPSEFKIFLLRQRGDYAPTIAAPKPKKARRK